MKKEKFDYELLARLDSYLPIIEFRKKVQNAVLDMMKKVVISQDHVYTRVSDNKFLLGVTSVSGLVPKDWMSAWGAKEAVKALGYSDYPEDTKQAEIMLEKLKKATLSQYLAILKEAKGASSRKSKEAQINGSAGHKWIEDYIRAKIRNESTPKLPDEKDMLARPLNQFVAWEQKNILLWILSEARVCDTGKEYAGTLDALALMKDNTSAIIDAKFSSHISPEYALQLAAYKATFENYGIVIDKRIIIRLPKTLEKDEWDSVNKKYNKIENTIEVKEIDTPYNFDIATFYSAIQVKKWCNYILKK